MIDYFKTDITNWVLYHEEMAAIFKQNGINENVKDLLYGFFLSFRLTILILCFGTRQNNNFNFENQNHRDFLVSLWGIQLTE